jgi:hypothetical protein
MNSIACPECGCIDWTQTQDYQATDRHWLTWSDADTKYNFTYELQSTSDENTGNWFCQQNLHEADDKIQELLEERMSLK